MLACGPLRYSNYRFPDEGGLVFGQAHRDVAAVRAASLTLRVRCDLCRSLISPAHELAIAAFEARRFLGDAQHARHPVIARGELWGWYDWAPSIIVALSRSVISIMALGPHCLGQIRAGRLGAPLVCQAAGLLATNNICRPVHVATPERIAHALHDPAGRALHGMGCTARAGSGQPGVEQLKPHSSC